MSTKLIITSLAFLIFFSCKSRKDNDKVIAEAFDNTLYLSQAMEYMPKEIDSKDSVRFLKEFTSRWLNQQVLINAIKQDDKIDIIEIEEKIEHQKNQLIVNEYKKHLISNKLDTTVDDSVLRQYYKDNEALFKINQTIVNAIYIQVPKKDKHLREVNRLLAKSDSAGKVQLYNYCNEFADTYITTDTNWVTFSNFVLGTPFQNTNPERFVTNIKRTFSTQQDHYSFLKVNRSKLKEEIAPFQYYKSNIKNKIITDRKAKLFETTQNILLNSARNTILC